MHVNVHTYELVAIRMTAAVILKRVFLSCCCIVLCVVSVSFESLDNIESITQLSERLGREGLPSIVAISCKIRQLQAGTGSYACP